MRGLFVTRALVVFVTLVLLAPAGSGVAGEADLSLASIVSGAADRRITLQDLAEGPTGVLAAVAGTETFPIPCATPLLQGAGATGASPEPLRQAIGLVSAPPPIADESVYTTRDGQFAIHYSSSDRSSGLPADDRNRDGLSDRVLRLAESLAASRSYLVDTMGYPDPAGAAGRLEIYLVRLGHGIEGYVPPARRTAAGAGSRFVVLDAGLSTDRVLPAAMHQLAHAALLSLTDRPIPVWWSEATASFLTLAATGDLEGQRPALQARLQAAGHGLTSDRLLLMQGALLWPVFLSERTGDAGIVRRIWDEMTAPDTTPLQAADRVLRRSAGLTSAEALRELAAWTLFTGSHDDGRHFSFAHSLPEPALPVIGPGLPFILGPVEPVEAYGSVAFRLPAGGGHGALDLEISAEGGSPAGDLLVFYRRGGEPPVLVPLPMENGGIGRVTVPWSEAREAWIILRNTAPPPGEPARFEVRGTLDPYAPYDLASFTTGTFGRSVLLEWTTASERGLLGWNVYRSERPTGPFVRLNDVAIPAYGDGTADTGYIFVDGGAREGRRYYYVLEGLTTTGLTQRSHLASVRTRRPRRAHHD